MKPVSYTHLTEPHLTFWIHDSNDLVACIVLLITTISVSYTHLTAYPFSKHNKKVLQLGEKNLLFSCCLSEYE